MHGSKGHSILNAHSGVDPNSPNLSGYDCSKLLNWAQGLYNPTQTSTYHKFGG
jgi:hypothetical protein